MQANRLSDLRIRRPILVDGDEMRKFDSSTWTKRKKEYIKHFEGLGLVRVFRTPVWRYPSGRQAHGWIAVGPNYELMVSAPMGYKGAEDAMSSAEFVFKHPHNASGPLQDDGPLWDVVAGVYSVS